MAGDNFELAAHAYYNSADDNNDPQYTDNAAMVESLITALSVGGPGGPGGPGDGPGGPGGPGGNFGALQTMLNGANYDQYDQLRQNVTDNTLPQSYINYMMFDEQMQLLQAQSGAVQVKSASADAWSVTGTDGSINITNNGYLLVFLGNNQDRDVYWDDLHVLHKKGRLLEENHYYPHGLTIRSGISSPLPTRQGYQGKELQDEVGMELYDFHARQYDPQVGRFWGVDPMNQFPSGYTGMGNDPANLIDPTGMASGGGGTAPYNAFDVTPVFQGATFEGLHSPFETQNFYEDVLQPVGGGSGSTESAQASVEVPTTETCQGDDIIVTGSDNNKITIPADGANRNISVPFALKDTRTIDIGLKGIDLSHFALGYTTQVDLQIAAIGGFQIGGEITYPPHKPHIFQQISRF